MKSKGLQSIVLSKYQAGDTPAQIHRHFSGGISLATIKIWYQMTRQSNPIQLLGTLAAPRIVRTLEENI